ncbi:3-oxo-5-alpha-steroid 4-dehydrogenase-domain-containing protein [Mycena floridula]|nr:3-oxo-5-alpha-steroid 4-dehydrogenase-domain-containing protein [Mycena floridula]
MISLSISAAAKLPAFASKAVPLTISVSPESTIYDVKKKIAEKAAKFYPARQKIALKDDRKALADEVKLQDLDLKEGSELTVKDLGPQISWRTVFLIEYVGPMVVHPIFYHLSQVFYGKPVIHSKLQTYIYAFVMLHFLKRELETLFVHRFSHGTMPLRNIFKNSFHYHVLSGLFLAYDIYRPMYSAKSRYIRGTIRDNDTFLIAGAALWAFFEISNLITHINVRNLRPEGTKKRAIPTGYGFNLVSYPNYFFEVCGWAVIAGMTGSLAASFFLIVSGVQCGIWALKKHKAYKKEFGKEYPRGRKAMIPFIL